jgi:hypothetical protein
MRETQISRLAGRPTRGRAAPTSPRAQQRSQRQSPTHWCSAHAWPPCGQPGYCVRTRSALKASRHVGKQHVSPSSLRATRAGRRARRAIQLGRGRPLESEHSGIQAAPNAGLVPSAPRARVSQIPRSFGQCFSPNAASGGAFPGAIFRRVAPYPRTPATARSINRCDADSLLTSTSRQLELASQAGVAVVTRKGGLSFFLRAGVRSPRSMPVCEHARPAPKRPVDYCYVRPSGFPASNLNERLYA